MKRRDFISKLVAIPLVAKFVSMPQPPPKGLTERKISNSYQTLSNNNTPFNPEDYVGDWDWYRP